MSMHKELITPENIALTVNVPSTWDRAEAFIIDLVILFITTLVIAFACSFIRIISPALGNSLLMLSIFFAWNGYFIYYELKRGATIGKKKRGFRIVSADGNFLSPNAVYVRNLMREVEFFLPLKMLLVIAFGQNTDLSGAWPFIWLLAFLFFPFFHKQNKRLGDIFAGTIVISIRDTKLQKDLILAKKIKANAESKNNELDFHFTEEMLDIYGKEELQVLEKILRSYSNLPLQQRKKLFATLIQKITKKIGYKEIINPKQHNDFLNDFYQQQRKYLENKLIRGKSLKRRTERKGRSKK